MPDHDHTWAADGFCDCGHYSVVWDTEATKLANLRAARSTPVRTHRLRTSNGDPTCLHDQMRTYLALLDEPAADPDYRAELGERICAFIRDQFDLDHFVFRAEDWSFSKPDFDGDRMRYHLYGQFVLRQDFYKVHLTSMVN